MLAFLIVIMIFLVIILICMIFGVFQPKEKKWGKQLKRLTDEFQKKDISTASIEVLLHEMKALHDEINYAYKNGYIDYDGCLKKVLAELKKTEKLVKIEAIVRHLKIAYAEMVTFERIKQREAYESMQAMNRSRSTSRMSRRYGGGRGRRSAGFFDSSSDSSSSNKGRSLSDYHDNHWESSFDWKDRDNDGYDDRNDGFWQEAE